MYWDGDDHSVPHFHARYGGVWASKAIDDLKVLAGQLPRRAQRLVFEWARLHQQEFLANWQRARLGEPLERIAPLSYDSCVITVRRVEPLGGYRLRLTFSDGLVGELDVDPRERGPMFEPLVDPAYFRVVRVSRAAGAIVWPNGLDLAPETLHRRVQAQHRPAATG